jgi:hypothetical protein
MTNKHIVHRVQGLSKLGFCQSKPLWNAWTTVLTMNSSAKVRQAWQLPEDTQLRQKLCKHTALQIPCPSSDEPIEAQVLMRYVPEVRSARMRVLLLSDLELYWRADIWHPTVARLSHAGAPHSLFQTVPPAFAAGVPRAGSSYGMLVNAACAGDDRPTAAGCCHHALAAAACQGVL